MHNDPSTLPAVSGMPATSSRVRSERGVALLAALSFLILMALIAGGLLLSVNSDQQLVQRSMGDDQALSIAEAGVAEATERIRTGEIPSAPNPRMVGQIFLCDAEDLPAMGADTVALATWQTRDMWLLYSTPDRSPEALTVRFKTDAAQRRIYRFDESRVPAIQTTSGVPIYVVNSTGQQGESQRRIITEMTRANLRIHDANVWGAITSGGDVRLSNDTHVCGYNHRADTPEWTGRDGRTGQSHACNEDESGGQWEQGPAVEHRFGVWASGSFDDGGSPPTGDPQAWLDSQNGFYTGCWQVLDVSESEFYSMLGPPQHARKPKVLQGITYYKGATTLEHCDGEGLLYVDGDLHVGKEFTYRGLVYATGRIVVDGPCWVLGAMTAGGSVTANSGNRCIVLYSREAIESAVSRYATRFVRLSWREG